MRRPGNHDAAEVLERVADLLEAQRANPHRVRAYRNAARTVRASTTPLAALLAEHGVAGLENLPAIGSSIAATLREYLETGRLAMLERLEGQVAPEDLFTTVPGIGETLAHRIHAELGIETLEELELAAHDGRLEQVGGIGRRRIQALRDVLAGLLTRSMRRRARRVPGPLVREPEGERPTVADLLAVDAQYRDLAARGALRRIAPRRFNPRQEVWLPILHTELNGWSYTAIYSNTWRAHSLNRIGDWVVLYFERDGHENQRTVVTERAGALAGRRVVRGREAECSAHYGVGGPEDRIGAGRTEPVDAPTHGATSA